MVKESIHQNQELIFLRDHLQRLQIRYDNKSKEVATLHNEIQKLKIRLTFMEKALTAK